MSYDIYLRKSRVDLEAEKRGDGETLAKHERTLLELAKSMNLELGRIYREVVSGETIASRPEMQKLLVAVEQGACDGVLVMDIDRLARGDTMDQGIVAQTFKYSDTKIITPTKTYDPNNEFDEEYFEFGLFMSRREYKTINRRMQRGRTASVKEGKFVGNKTPYGYTRVPIKNDKGFTLEPHPEEAEIVRLIFELYSKGELQPDGAYRRLGVSLIVRKLNEIKAPTRNGGSWSVATVRGMLTNPVYAGKIRWNHRAVVKSVSNGQVEKKRPRNPESCVIVDGLHEPLIDQSIYDIVNEYMAKNKMPRIGGDFMVKNPLAGIVVCGKCGKRMQRRPYDDRSKQDTLMCADTSCGNVSSALHYVERAILDSLAEWLRDYKIKWDFPDKAGKSSSQIKLKKKAISKAIGELDDIKNQTGKLHDLLEQGIYTTEVFLERSRVLSERSNRLNAEVAALEVSLKEDRMREEGRENIIPKVEVLLETYDGLTTPKAKNDILREVLEKVVYIKTNKGRWHNAPDDFEIILYPRLPKST